MSVFQAFILGIVQGLTEFLPVSSSGHLEIGQSILGINTGENLYFDLILHLATVLSTLFVFRKDIVSLLKGLFQFKWNDETRYIALLLFSAIPVLFVGIFLKDYVESLFSGNAVFVGFMLLFTAFLLASTHFVKKGEGEITFLKSFIIGIAQAIAVIPGISRSGATIATGLLIKTKKENVARFSFLMVIIPILGAAFLELISGKSNSGDTIGLLPLVTGFTTAFVTGALACTWMIKIVRKGNLLYFAIYCFIIGMVAIIAG